MALVNLAGTIVIMPNSEKPELCPTTLVLRTIKFFSCSLAWVFWLICRAEALGEPTNVPRGNADMAAQPPARVASPKSPSIIWIFPQRHLVGPAYSCSPSAFDGFWLFFTRPGI